MASSTSLGQMDTSQRMRIKKVRQRRRESSNLPFNRKLWLKFVYEMAITSMFFLPACAIFGSVFLGFALSAVDQYMADQGIDPPLILATNVDSARSVLSSVAGATISFAGTAFSVSLLVIQLGSSQYSPRIVHTLFKDSFSQRIVAFVVGTFTYCLVVMRWVDIETEDAPVVVPNFSVSVAVVLGILSVLFIVAYIDHSANTMDVSQLLGRVTQETIEQIHKTWKKDCLVEGDCDDEDAGDKASVEDDLTMPESNEREQAEAEADDDVHVVRFRSSGWVQEIDFESLLQLVPANGYIKVHTLAGRYAIPNTAICSVFPKPKNADLHYWPTDQYFEGTGESTEHDEYENLCRFDDFVLDTIMIGPSRSTRSDPTFGLRQLVDVILRALSPGVNDPTTAQDGIFHVADVVSEFLQRKAPPSVIETDEGGKLIVMEQQDYDSIVRLGFDEARICAASSPTVALYLLESLRLIRDALTASGRAGRAPEIERQARLIEGGIRNASHLDEDYLSVANARRNRFDILSTDVYKQSLKYHQKQQELDCHISHLFVGQMRPGEESTKINKASHKG